MLKIKFNGYKYNTGSGDNGKYLCEEKFKQMNESIEFALYIINLIKKHKNNSKYSKKDHIFFEKYNIDFVIEFVGLSEVETVERELNISNFL